MNSELPPLATIVAISLRFLRLLLFPHKTCALLLWAILLVPSARSAIPSAPGATLFPVTEITLSNGLQILTLEDHSSPLVAVQIWYHVGSADEPAGRQGFAHLFEHMMFRGTDHLGPTDHFDLLHSIGGDCNAYTAFDETCYHETLPAQQLELALWLESERMAFLTVDAAGFTTERKVVEEERRLNLGLPYGEIADKGPPLIFGQHPYGHDPLGTFRDLRQATPSDVHDWWASRYTPDNATLVIVGDVKTESARAMCERYFGWIPPVRLEPRNIPTLGPWEEPQEITLNLANAPAPGVGMVWRTVPEGDADALAMDLLGTILGGDALAIVQGSANSSRLYRRLVAEEHLAVMATALQFSMSHAGVFGAGAALSPIGGDPARTLSALRAEIERLCAQAVTDAELEKARSQVGVTLLREAQTVAGKASLIGRAAVLGKGVPELNSRLERLRNITRADLQRATQKYLDPKRAMTVTLPGSSLWNQLANLFFQNRKSEEAAPAAFASDILLRGRPGVTRPVDFPLQPPLSQDSPSIPNPIVEEHRLRNGLRVLVIPKSNTSMVQAVLALPFGSWAESKPGAAAMALRLLAKGTELHDEKALAEELDRYGIQLSGSADHDDSRVQMSCLLGDVERAFGLMAEVVARPTFPKALFNTAITQARTELQIADTTPFVFAEREFERHLFSGHPYGRRALGDPTDLAALKVEDLALFWQSVAKPDKASLIIAGGLTGEQALALAEHYFGDWRPKDASGTSKVALSKAPDAESQTRSIAPPEITPPPAPDRPGATHILLVDSPGASQSQICIGGLGIATADKDKPIANLVGSYFGGTFGSRLMKAIRVEKGSTYGASGGFQANRFAGSFLVQTFTKTASTAETVRIALAEIKGLVERPPSMGELSLHKRYFLGSAAARFETPSQIASQFTHIALNGLPIDHLQRSLATISSATPNQCKSFARRVVDADHLLIVVVGDASIIARDLAAIAQVSTIDRDGHAVTPK
jgi:zinc protease